MKLAVLPLPLIEEISADAMPLTDITLSSVQTAGLPAGRLTLKIRPGTTVSPDGSTSGAGVGDGSCPSFDFEQAKTAVKHKNNRNLQYCI